jgi:hypothetical protein
MRGTIMTRPIQFGLIDMLSPASQRFALRWIKTTVLSYGATRVRPGPGWFWYAADNRSVEDVRVTRAFAQASRDLAAKELLGIALLDAQLAVWADLSHTDRVAEWLDRLAFDLAQPLES